MQGFAIRIEPVKEALAGKNRDDLTIDDFLRFPHVPYTGMISITEIGKYGRKDVDPFEFHTDEEQAMYVKYLKSHPAEDEIIEIAKRHLDPLGVSQNGYSCEFGTPGLSGVMSDIDSSERKAFLAWAEDEGITPKELSEKLRNEEIPRKVYIAKLGKYGFIPKREVYAPCQYKVEVTIKKEHNDSSISELVTTIYVESKRAEELEDRFDIKWKARSQLLSKEWLDAKLGRENTFYLVVGASLQT
ncbi:hypothetical protein ACFL6I_22365, partial [candidate division KSB1 bacterium]